MPSVRLEKRGDSWQYSFEGAKVDGRRRRISKSGFKTKSEASRAGNEALCLYLDTGKLIKPSRMSFNDLLDEWLSKYCTYNINEESRKNYAKRIRIHIKPSLGMYSLGAITPGVLQDFVYAKAAEGYSRNTMTVIKGILSGCLGYAVKMDYIRYNPMHEVKLPSYRNSKIRSRTAPHQYIPPDEIRDIFTYFTPESSVYIPILLGYKCGLRIGEAYALTWDDIDFNKKTLTVNKQVQWNQYIQSWYITPPKYESYRTIELDSETVKALKEKYERQEKSKVFLGDRRIINYADSKGNINQKFGTELKLINLRDDGSYIQPRTMQHASRIIHYKLGYPNFTYHSLRHTHATMLAENNASPLYVKERLGHKNVKLTLEIYQHLTDKMRDDGASLLENTFKIS